MKQFKTTFATIIILACWICGASAQNMSLGKQSKYALLDSSIMQQADPLANELSFPFALSDTMALHALDHLQKTFVSACNVKWERTPSNGYMAAFVYNKTSTMVVYNCKGNWVHTIYDYGETQMPQNIREKIKDAYSGFSISYVDEVHVNNATIYLVHIVNPSDTKTIRVCGDAMSEVQPKPICKQ
jgi:hypothetical protein